jgi:hypothetical protein
MISGFILNYCNFLNYPYVSVRFTLKISRKFKILTFVAWPNLTGLYSDSFAWRL